MFCDELFITPIYLERLYSALGASLDKLSLSESLAFPGTLTGIGWEEVSRFEDLLMEVLGLRKQYPTCGASSS